MNTEAKSLNSPLDTLEGHSEVCANGLEIGEVILLRCVLSQEHERQTNPPLQTEGPSEQSIWTITMGKMLIPEMQFKNWSPSGNRRAVWQVHSAFRTCAGNSQYAIGPATELSNSKDEAKAQIEGADSKYPGLSEMAGNWIG